MREELNYGALLSLPLIRGERKLAIVVDFFFFFAYLFLCLCLHLLGTHAIYGQRGPTTSVPFTCFLRWFTCRGERFCQADAS